jgi:hypothetical protein
MIAGILRVYSGAVWISLPVRSKQTSSGRETMKTSTWIAFIATSALALSATAIAQDTDPAVGTWKLNVAKSTYDPASAKPKGETRTYEATPDGKVRLSIEATAANGQSRKQGSTYLRDGKPYPFENNPNMDSMVVVRVNPRETTTTELKDGKVIGYQTSAISADGTTMTMKRTFTTASGQPQHDVRVYERQ